MKKRLLALFMSLCLVVGLLPTAAWAAEEDSAVSVSTEEELRAAINAADGTKENPTEIELQSNIDLKATLVIDGNTSVFISGNSYTISRVTDTWDADNKNIIIVKGTLYVTDCTIDAKQCVHVILVSGGYLNAENTNFTGTYNKSSYGAIGVNQNGSMDLIGGAIFNNESRNRAAVVSDNGAKCTLTNTKVYDNTTWKGDAPVFVTYGTGTLTINGGEIYGNKNHYDTQNPYDFSNGNDVNCVVNNSNQVKISGDVYIHDNTIQIDNELPMQRDYGCGYGNSSYRSNDLKGICLTSPLTHDAVVAVMEWTDPTIERRTLFRGVDGYNLTKEDLEKVDITIGKWFSNTAYTYDKNDLLICLNEEENTIEACAKANVVLKDGEAEQPANCPKYIATTIDNPFSKQGFTFNGWKKDGSDDVYASDATFKFTDNEEVTLVAQWVPYTLLDVTVTPKADAEFAYGDTLTPADFVVTEVYDNGETEVVDPASYTVSPDKLDTVGSVGVTVTYNDKEYTCTITVAKATQAAPAAPELADRTYTSITLKEVEGAEYKCGDGEWRTSPEFTDLTAGTIYAFQVRYAETDTHAASEASEAAEFATLTQTSSGGGGGSSRNNSYAVSTPEADNGSVTVNNGSTAKKGDTVTITVKPDAGYEIDKVTVTDSKGNTIAVTNKGDGKFSFTMPDSKVDVKATFVKAEVKPDQPSKTAFVDVPENSWYADAADFVAQRGLMSGVGENLFGGNQNTTRAMLMTILARMDGQDVTGGSTWYEKAMNWAKQTGVSDGTMPEVNITREQLATMLYSYAKLKGMDPIPNGMALSKFSDYETISAWASDAVSWAAYSGIISGRSNGTVDPQAGATRAEMAVMLQQFVGLMEK